MSAPLKVTFLGALQASISVILTLGYGVLGSRFGLISKYSAKDLSQLCVKMFLPMLILTTVGSEMASERGGWGRYGAIVLWSLVYTTISIGYGKGMGKLFGLPSWTAPACSFNNTTSLPLLLVQALATTGLLDPLSGGNPSSAVSRAKSYFLINSMISNSYTFAVGPKLLAEGDNSDESDNDDSDDKNERTPLLNPTPRYNNLPHPGERRPGHDSDSSEDIPVHLQRSQPPEAELPFEDNDSQVLLSNDEEHVIGLAGQPVPSSARVVIPTRTTRRRMRDLRNSCWRIRYTVMRHAFVRKVWPYLIDLVNPALVGTLLAVLVAVIPGLGKAMFGRVQEGAWLRGWFTSSLENVGDLFTVMQMFVVGVKLDESMFGAKKEEEEDEDSQRTETDVGSDEEDESPRVPVKALLVIYALRFAIWPVLSILCIYGLVKKQLIANDPILWFAMMIMPVGPPAILLSSLTELKGNDRTKLEVAKLLFISYSITPIICFAIVGAMKTCETLM